MPAPPGATAVTAALTALVLGLITGVAGGMWVRYMVVSIEEHASEYYSEGIDGDTNLVAMGAVTVVIGLTWYVGGYLLLAYMKTGRLLLILSSVVALIVSVGELFNSGFPFLFFPIIVSALILVLCVAPATGRWLVANELAPNTLAHDQGPD